MRLTFCQPVLPAAHRMRRSADFTATVRGGQRSRRGSVVVHLARQAEAPQQRLVGFIVSREVGGSVVRHRVARRLRAAVATRLPLLPAGSATVVRALPPAARASSAELGRDLDAALHTLGVPA